MGAYFAFQLGKFPGQFLVCGKQFSQFDESPHHINACLDCSGRVQHAGCHDRPVFGKGIRQDGGESEPGKVVTICDHLLLLGLGQLEAKIARKSFLVSPDGLVVP